MPGIWNNTAAFEPFYTDFVMVEAARKGGRNCGGSFRCMVSRDGYDEPLDDASSHVSRLVISVTIPKSGSDGWCVQTQDAKPRIGDTVILQDSTKWSVFSVSEDDQTFLLRAREKGSAR